MKRQRMQLRLVPSKRMDQIGLDSNPEEHDFIRLGAAARAYFAPNGDIIRVFTAQGGERFLQLQKALIDDLRGITKPNDRRTGFVTTSTYKAIRSDQQVPVWVSESESDLMLGSDPEFGLLDEEGAVQYASHVVNYGKNAALGTDGPSMELRPAPANNVEGHLEAITTLMKKGVSDPLLNKSRWFTGAMLNCKKAGRVFVFGGHIHVGDPAILAIQVKKTEGLSVEDVHRRLIRILDDLVGLPLTRIDGPDAGPRRAGKSNNNFGFFGDFRQQPNRFEWRTPSAVWLTDPVLAKAVLGTVKAVTEHAYVLLVENKFEPTWIRGDASKKSLLRAIGAKTDTIVRNTLHKSAPDLVDRDTMAEYHARLRGLSTYEKYREEIDSFIAITSVDPAKVKKLINYFGTKEAWAGEKSAIAL